MRQRLISLLLAGLAFLTGALSAVADTSFILRTAAPPDLIASRHGLTLVRPLDDQGRGLYLMTSPDLIPAAQMEIELDADVDVTGCEFDLPAVLPENPQASLPGLSQSTAHILDALGDRTPVIYYGAPVWNAYLTQPAAGIVRTNEAHAASFTGFGTVAIIDTGVDPKHPALAGAIVAGYDFVRDLPGVPSEFSDLDPATAAILNQSTAHILDTWAVATLSGTTAAVLDQSTAHILDGTGLPAAFGHGTMVAGVVRLVAPTALIMPLKAFRSDGTTDIFSILRAIYYAADHGARVVNMSFSLPGSSAELARAVDYAMERGVICVSSVGNAGQETLVYPAAIKDVIGVASTNALDVRSTFSNYGSHLVDIAAPGEEIVTTYPGGYWAAASGTSFSAPLVAGGASLLLQRKPSMEQGDVRNALSHGKKVSGDIGQVRLDLVQALATVN